MKNGLEKFVDTIKSNFSIGEPIFPKEILALFSYSRQQVYSYLKEAIKLNQIKRADDYYYIPKYETVFGIRIDNKPTYESIVNKKYLGDDKNVIGIYSGRTLENKLNISEQVPYTEEIVSNNTKKLLKKAMINNVNVVLRKPYVKITNENKKEYILLQLLTDIEKEMLNEKKNIIKIYIDESGISKKRVFSLSENFPSKTRKRLKEVFDEERRAS